MVREVDRMTDEEWLDEFVSQWHLLADLSFSDLVLWKPIGIEGEIFECTAQVRPVTGPTALEDDIVGERIEYDPEHQVTVAYMTHEISETSNNAISAGIPVDVWAIPVLRRDNPIAVIERHTNQMGMRATGALEENFLEAAEILTQMLLRGEFPLVPPSDKALAPRPADGVLRVQPDGVISYASPNAITAFRRLGALGDIEGEHFRELTRRLRQGVESVGQTVNADLDGRLSLEFDVETRGSSMRCVVLPLWFEYTSAGMLVLCRDTTDLTRRDRMLLTKDATIREIHHRVKNNLQTVAALLRMQSRRLTSEEGKEALRDAMRRVSSIAMVHETLSYSLVEEVEFDELCDKILDMVGDLAASNGTVRAVRRGSFGVVPADMATSLSMIVTELCQNAVEHGLSSSSGMVEIVPNRDGGILEVEILDAGRGLPEGFRLGNQKSLGLSIISTLIHDLHGTLSLSNREDGQGTVARIRLPVPGPDPRVVAGVRGV
ncbi:Two-component sensor histidine kinase, contains HisKA and HATPase domains [Tessaracoccus bendigoensis DSM 12906]|uniref:histidine kinase n=2 Tax=Tessaracoccus TaxID=72763 RepID=A0A1M6GEA3_9ACTN|nr:Two-component sensor histidine kinase, contains HisKA and HATPase domains [Tessaracoccus bendigoensis DSM 12906]